MKKIVRKVSSLAFAFLVGTVVCRCGLLAAEEEAAQPVVVPTTPEVIEKKLVELVPDGAVFLQSCEGLEKVWADIVQSNFWKQFAGLKLWDATGVRMELAESKKEFLEDVGVELSTENIMSLIGKEVVVALFVEPAPAAEPVLQKLETEELPREGPAEKEPAAEKGEESEETPEIAPPAEGVPALELPEGAEEAAAETAALEEDITKKVEKELAETLEEEPAETPRIHVVLLCRENPKETAEKNIKKLVDFLKKEAREEVEFKETSHDGTKITTISASESPVQVQYGFVGDVFALGVGNTSPQLEKVVGLSKGKGDSVANNPQFKKVLDATRMEGGRYLGCFYADLERFGMIFDAMDELDIPFMFQAMFQGMKQSLSMPFVTGGTAHIDRGLVMKAVTIPTSKEKDELTQLSLGARPAVSANLKYVPENTIGYAGASGIPDLEKVWPLLLQQWESQGATMMMNMVLGSVETAFGIKIAEDVIPWVGDELGAAFTDMDMKPGFPYPKFALMTKIKDKKKATAFAGKLTKVLKELSEQKGLKLETAVHEGCTVNSVALAMPMAIPISFTLSYGVVEDFFMVGTSADLIKQLIDTSKGRVKNLASSAAFKSLNIPAETNATFFFNWGRFMEVGKAVAAWVVEFVKAQPTMAASAESVKAVVENHVVPLMNCLSALESLGGYEVNQANMATVFYIVRVKDLPRQSGAMQTPLLEPAKLKPAAPES